MKLSDAIKRDIVLSLKTVRFEFPRFLSFFAVLFLLCFDYICNKLSFVQSSVCTPTMTALSLPTCRISTVLSREVSII